jgi:hypothetical protein
VLHDSDGAKCMVYAFAIRDVFDKKEPVKDLRFFNTSGVINNTTVNLWIAMPKSKLHIHGNYLFSEKTASTKRQLMESYLNLKCGPLTVSQRTGDWFVLRRFHFTGTLGANIDPTSVYTNESKLELFNKCVNSWFGRHKSTVCMQQGSANESFIVQRLQQQEWVTDVFEVGMLQSKIGSPWISVSPDAILVGTVNSPNGLPQEEEEQILFVELKT